MPWPSSRTPGQTGGVFTWTVMPAPGPIGALTVGATAAGLALVAFGDHPEAAARAAERLGLPAVAHEPARSNRQAAAITRWQGTTTGSGLLPMIAPTPRVAVWALPSSLRAASSP